MDEYGALHRESSLSILLLSDCVVGFMTVPCFVAVLGWAAPQRLFPG
jgi:hypothetical protein